MGYAISVLGFFSLAGPIYGQPLSFSEALPYLSIGLSGLAALGFSLALLFEEARHRFWGILVVAPYGTGSFYYLTQLYFPVLIHNATIPLPEWFWPLAGALFLGLAGAVGGIIWKPREARTEPRACSNQSLKD